MLVAGFGGFKSKPYFSAQPGAETTPKVDFNSAPAQPAATK
jgi:hypothetical protein